MSGGHYHIGIALLLGRYPRTVTAILEVECCDRLVLCSVEYKNAVVQRKDEIIEFCKKLQPDS